MESSESNLFSTSGSGIRSRFGRNIPLSSMFSSFRNSDKVEPKQHRRGESSLLKREVLDETSEDDSDESQAPTCDVMISVHDEVIHETKSFTTSDDGVVEQQYHDENLRSSFFCAAQDELFTSLLDGFFHQESEDELHRLESVSRTCSNYETRIECILQEAYAEDRNVTLEDGDAIIPSQIHAGLSADHSLPYTSKWKQHPLLLTATPNSGMTIRGIRRLCDPSFLDIPINSQCANDGNLIQLPINNGREKPRHSWVIDFETELFAGTALFRIRGCNTKALTTEDSSYDGTNDYFGDKNRKYHVCIRGRFKKKVVMATCMSGLLLDRPLVVSRKRNSNAPPRWILRAAVKIANILSPRMDAQLEGDHPRVLSPLCSTAQTIRKHHKKEEQIYLDEPQEEPRPDAPASLLSDLKKKCDDKICNEFDQYRKRIFNAIYDDYERSHSTESPYFDDSEYTFEFLQHLVDYNDLSLDLGRAIGKMKIGVALSGQPVRITAITSNDAADDKARIASDTCLWAFDLWHASNVEDK